MNLNVNFKKTIGKMKPLNGVCCAPYNIEKGDEQQYINKYFKEGNIPFCRLHDVEYPYGGNYFVDITRIFRNFDADENDPENYDFHYTDEYITAIQQTGCQTYYRLGESIEWGSKKYATLVPKDFKKWARICEHIIRHYNFGWADGFEYGIEYWEIWNEPENPGSKTGLCMWGGTKEEFFALYDTASKHLKRCFPELKIGGYASCGFYAVFDPNATAAQHSFVDYFINFLEMVKEKSCPLDFFSWHIYTDNEKDVLLHAKYVRQTLDEYGFTETESHLNEWNFEGTSDMRSTTHTARFGCFLTAAMTLMQNAGYVDKAMYYVFSLKTVYNAFINQNDYTTSPSWYPYEAYGMLTALGNAVETTQDGDGIYAIAAKNESDNLILISNYTPERNECVITTDTVGKAKATIIDESFKGFENAESLLFPSDKFTLTLPEYSVALIKVSID